MKHLIHLIILSNLLTFNVYANEKENENKPLIEMLVIAKSTGMCGNIKQLVAFQETTKMDGGDDFLLRFLNTEAARLGQDLPELLTQCKSSISIYTRTMESLGYK